MIDDIDADSARRLGESASFAARLGGLPLTGADMAKAEREFYALMAIETAKEAIDHVAEAGYAVDRATRYALRVGVDAAQLGHLYGMVGDTLRQACKVACDLEKRIEDGGAR